MKTAMMLAAALAVASLAGAAEAQALELTDDDRLVKYTAGGHAAFTIDLGSHFTGATSYTADPPSGDSSLSAVTYEIDDAAHELIITPVHGVHTGENAQTLSVYGHDGPDQAGPLTITFEIAPAPYGDSNDWKHKPTFGVSWQSGELLVEDGFTFNGYNLDITDNWHTEFARTSSIIGDENAVTAKAYSENGFDLFSLALGVPYIGVQHEAETEIIVDLERDYESDAGYVVKSVEHVQKEGLVDEDATAVSISRVQCNSTGDAECLEFLVIFRVLAPLKYDPLSISVVDEDRRITTTYINEGVGFEGWSILEPATASHFVKKTSQDPGTTVSLAQADRRHNTWVDQDGYLWTQNDHGTWVQVTRPPVPERNDPPASVMTRQHSDFGIAGQAGASAAPADASPVQGTMSLISSYDLPGAGASGFEMLGGVLKAKHVAQQSAGGAEIIRADGVLLASGTVELGSDDHVVLRIFEKFYVKTVEIPVADDGSFAQTIAVDEALSYAYLEYDGEVIARD